MDLRSVGACVVAWYRRARRNIALNSMGRGHSLTVGKRGETQG